MGFEGSAAQLVGAVMLVAMIVYTLTGGADFGGGLWDLLARGSRAASQRAVIERAIAPIWEANHVWMVLVVVLLFVGFPLAFSTITTVLHIPLTLMLIGIVMRGAAFAFRNHEYQSDLAKRRWSHIFAFGSILTPIFLGVIVGAIASGSIRVDVVKHRVALDFLGPWLALFPWAVGALTLVLFAFLAAVYLTLEVDQPELAEDFRKRALASGIALVCFGIAVLLLAPHGAPIIARRAAESRWGFPVGASGALIAVAALWALWTRRYRLARPLAAGLAAVMLAGWGLAQFPNLVVPDLTIDNTAAAPYVLKLLLIVLLGAGVLLVPALIYLFVVFKSRRNDG